MAHVVCTATGTFTTLGRDDLGRLAAGVVFVIFLDQIGSWLVCSSASLSVSTALTRNSTPRLRGSLR